MDRLEALTSKLSHELYDIRFRAANNLLSKIESGIVDNSMLELPMFITGLSNKLLDGIKIGKNTNDINFQSVLFKIISNIGKYSIYCENNNFTQLVSELSVLSELGKEEKIEGNYMSYLNSVIFYIFALITNWI